MPARSAIFLIAFVVGAATLGSEIAAARLLAPWFGSSTIVWANTIATVLVALSIGYWIGGRWADRDPTLRGLARVVVVGAALLAVVPFVAEPVLRVSVDALDSVNVGAAAGSLLTVLVLVAAPLVVLGMVAPYAVRLAVTRVEEAGTVAGRLYAVSTAGSLVGVFLAALLLIPELGTQRTFVVFSLACGLVALLGLRPLRRTILAPAGLALLLAVPPGTVKATGDEDGRVIWERETEYQYA
ncbi:MAG TPA: fused MFS/spermidine synthase, partial [Baekduia sp.]|nr:fused MFS/spermidine synthase [Baekduia sp.]